MPEYWTNVKNTEHRKQTTARLSRTVESPVARRTWPVARPARCPSRFQDEQAACPPAGATLKLAGFARAFVQKFYQGVKAAGQRDFKPVAVGRAQHGARQGVVLKPALPVEVLQG